MASKTQTATPTEDTQESMEALFDELSQARATGTELPAAPPEKPEPEPEPKEAAPAPAAAPDDAAVPVATAPVPETPSTPETPEKPAPKPAASVAFDKSQLSKEAREYVEAMEKDRQKTESERRAAIGRTAALQRELAMTKKLAEQSAPAPAADDDDPTKKLAVEFPELSRALEQAIAKTEQKFGQALSVKTQQSKADVLDGVFPGWLQTLQGPEFNYWLSQQDEPTQKLLDSDNVRDYAVMLRSYELASANSPEQLEPVETDVEPSEVERIQKERNARLKRSTHVQTKPGAPNPTGEPDESDPEALFNYRSRLRDKERERQQSRS